MSNVTFLDHLDDMAERLMNEDLTPEALDVEVKRSKALCQISAIRIENKKIELDFVQLISQGEINENLVPLSFLPQFKKIENPS